MTNLVGVALRGWSGHIFYFSHRVFSLFFLVCYVFLLGVLEIFKDIHFWKRYGIRIQKSDVGIFSDIFMVAILDYKNSCHIQR